MCRLFPGAAVAALFVLSSAASPAPLQRPVKHVVVLYPDSDGRPGNALFGDGLRSGFVTADQCVVETYNEYLDATRFPDDNHRRQYALYLRNKYQDLKVDLIISPMLPSLDFLMKYREMCFPGIPVVYAAVEERELESLRPAAGFMGRPMRFECAGTLDLALQLQPGAKHVYAVFGSSTFDQRWEERARREFAKYTDRLSFTYLTGLTLSELGTAAREFPADSIVYYFHVFSDRTGASHTPAHFLEQLADRIDHPIYGHVDTYLGRGIVGGRLMSFEAEGEHAARLALNVFNGADPGRFATRTPGETPATVDWRQLTRRGLAESALPSGTVVRFKEASMWDSYRWYVVGAMVFCVLQAALISVLLLQRIRLRRAELRFLQSLEATPNAKALVDADGRMVLVNAELERLFGYQRSELIGNKLETLLPARFHPHAVGQRGKGAARLGESLANRRELYGRRKDGSEVPLELKLSPVLVEKSPHFLATILDETERRQFETALRDSNRELVVLTGRLMRAQETERRRIARELHDDLNQSLGLVSVELDLLSQLPEGLAPHSKEKLSTISERVKQISSSVHELSHQLHPSKVEQLGLVASLRSLCLELGKSHDVAIEYIEQDVGRQLPAEVSLCLYRITQEALRNVIKHSRAGRATVELHCRERQITLVISDDGIGFDPNKHSFHAGLGLLSMRERARLVGGVVVIDALPGHGTQLEVTVPLAEEATGPGDPSVLEALSAR